MSVVTLKKKTLANNACSHSHPDGGFSLVGTRRSQGYVGQSSQSRHIVRTLMRGGAARGYGGCDGTYPKHILFSSDVVSLNNPNVVKAPVQSCQNYTRNLTHFAPSGFQQPTCFPPSATQPPYTVVKSDTNNNQNNSVFVMNKKRSCAILGSVPQFDCNNDSSLLNLITQNQQIINTTMQQNTKVCCVPQTNYNQPSYAVKENPAKTLGLSRSQSEYIALKPTCCLKNGEGIIIVSNAVGLPVGCSS